ncbi:MAG: TetR/AcrR family transcriptional regulator [Cyanobacteria bacterium SZAS LIN-2]|nr:TetR/AcrR family transcriptional regulator [Cyanobacteria bacterium SZAS LIN-3]MBS1996067.1 TetR/AcrR family transcriptional regulator [Cyanobacteria bacterium SZAS LIN-2]MBS2009319.1 TetR/AcrR family transcriptional regulator [Cyanobacteria bacterium SZAS TMP-1]
MAVDRKVGGDKKNSIKRAALKLFLRNGYEGTSVDDIASDAGVAKQTVYSHFRDKETLFRTLVGDLANGLESPNLSSADRERLSVRQYLEQIAESYFGQLDSREYYSFLRLIVAESVKFPGLSELYVYKVVELNNQILTTFLAANKELEFKDPAATAKIFRGALASHAMIQNVLMPDRPVRVEDRAAFIETLIDMVIASGKPRR